MPRAKILVYTKPVSEDQIASFEDWYDNIHIPEVLGKIEGIRSAERFVSPYGRSYVSLAVYGIEADDPVQVLSTMLVYAASGRFRMHPSLSRERNVVLLHEASG